MRNPIAEVKRYPVLWQTKDVNYKNKTVKENAWQAVAECVNKECDASYTGNKIEYIIMVFKQVTAPLSCFISPLSCFTEERWCITCIYCCRF